MTTIGIIVAYLAMGLVVMSVEFAITTVPEHPFTINDYTGSVATMLLWPVALMGAIMVLSANRINRVGRWIHTLLCVTFIQKEKSSCL